MTIIIEKNIPVPEDKYNRGYLSDTLRQMAVGDSFFYPDANSARASAVRIGKISGFKFITRKENNGIRVWRAR